MSSKAEPESPSEAEAKEIFELFRPIVEDEFRRLPSDEGGLGQTPNSYPQTLP